MREMKNVILVTIDTLRKDVVGCYGGDKFTPFLDSIQSRCLRFTNMKSIGPYTQASFPGILTSSYYFDYGRRKGLAPEATVVSEVLQRNGIVTAAYHSNPYLSGYFGWNRGWHSFYDSMQDDVSDMYPFVRGNVINEKVEKWLSEHVGSGKDYKPFFLWVHYMDVHEPYVPEKDYLRAIDSGLNVSKEEMFRLFKEVILKRDVSDRNKVEILKKLYLAKVMEVDDYVKELFGIFERSGILGDTVILITSDHGDEFCEHGGLSHDGKMYSELIDVPFLMYGVEDGAGGVCEKLVSNVDIPPTIVGLFGLGKVEAFKGRPLYPIEGYAEEGVFGEALGKRSAHAKDTDRPVYYYMDGSYKIIYSEEGDSWELYDVENDPEEKENIIDSSQHTKRLKERLIEWINS